MQEYLRYRVEWADDAAARVQILAHIAAVAPCESVATWGVKSCADPEYYAASDVPQTQVALLTEWYSVSTAAWGNYGPVEIWVVGNDVEAAKQLEDRWCEVHTAKDPKWNVVRVGSLRGQGPAFA